MPILRRADLLIANGDDTAAHYRARGFDVTVIKNAVDLKRWTMAPPKLKPPLHVAFIGRLAQVKGINEFLAAAREMAGNRGGPFVFHLAGDGPARDDALGPGTRRATSLPRTAAQRGRSELSSGHGRLRRFDLRRLGSRRRERRSRRIQQPAGADGGRASPALLGQSRLSAGAGRKERLSRQTGRRLSNHCGSQADRERSAARHPRVRNGQRTSREDMASKRTWSFSRKLPRDGCRAARLTSGDFHQGHSVRRSPDSWRHPRLRREDRAVVPCG